MSYPGYWLEVCVWGSYLSAEMQSVYSSVTADWAVYDIHTVVWFQIFLCNTNKLYTVVWFQVFLSNTNIYMVASKYFDLIIVL